MLKLMKMCIVHDLGEAIGGDVPAPLQSGRPAGDKSERETAGSGKPDREPAGRCAAGDPGSLAGIQAGMSPEAVLAKGFDKIETILQHGQGRNPPDFDYAFNLDYGRRWTDAHPLTRRSAISSMRTRGAGFPIAPEGALRALRPQVRHRRRGGQIEARLVEQEPQRRSAHGSFEQERAGDRNGGDQEAAEADPEP